MWSKTSEQKAHTDENRNDYSHVFVKFSEDFLGVANEEGNVGECETVAGDNPICARPDDQLCDLFFHSLVAFVRHAGEAFPTDRHGAAFIQDNSVGFVTDAHDFAPWLDVPQMGIVLINLTEHLEQFSDIVGGRWEHGDQTFNEPVIVIVGNDATPLRPLRSLYAFYMRHATQMYIDPGEAPETE